MENYTPIDGLTIERPDQELWNTVGCFPLLNSFAVLIVQTSQWQQQFRDQTFAQRLKAVKATIENFCYDLFAEKHGTPSSEIGYLSGLNDGAAWERFGFRFSPILDGIDLEQAVR